MARYVAEGHAVQGGVRGNQLDFDYDLAQFISFRDREACDRVRQITREQLPNHESPDFRIRIIGLGEGR